MTPTKLLTFCALCLLIFATSCKDDEIPDVPVQPELITTLTYTLTPEGGGDAVVLSFQDLDDDGPIEPVIQNGTLQNNVTYNGELTFLNESVDPSEDITEEVAEEDEEHQVFFVTNNDYLAVTYDDVDSGGNPVGLSSSLTTSQTGTTDLTITLRHEPNKAGENVSAGDITNAGGETDIEVTFNVEIE